jgi:hypothetical protein
MKNIIFTIVMISITTVVIAQTAKSVHTTTESTMVTINNNDRSYSLIAAYDSSEKVKIYNLIIKTVGSLNEREGNQISWKLKSTYTVLLKPERLIIDLDKELASKELIRKFDNLGEEIEQALAADKKSAKINN